MFLFVYGPALVCGWVNFPILWPYTPVQTKLKCPPGVLESPKQTVCQDRTGWINDREIFGGNFDAESMLFM